MWCNGTGIASIPHIGKPTVCSQIFPHINSESDQIRVFNPWDYDTLDGNDDADDNNRLYS
jgi:hypothetical protein